MIVHRRFVALAAILLCFASRALAAEPLLKLEKGDHICYIGNTLPDRMQHFGWLETLIYSRFPDQELVVRDLGYSGDEINHRERCDGFGSPDEWLAHEKADVIFAFFGFNESFAGPAGLGKFKAELDKFIKDTLPKNFSGKAAVRLILFSPIAIEDLHDPSLADPKRLNANIKLYANAMAEVASVNNVPFVDLFGPSQELYKSATKPLTINGIHMTEFGDQQLGTVIDRALFGTAAPARDSASLEKLRQAVNDKNFYFFERYRTLDGYNVYGGRSHLKYKEPLLAKPGEPMPEISNRDVMQREMQVLDVMTANRDVRVQAVAQGKDLTVDDSNTPPFIPVSTNFPGKNPDGSHPYESGEDAIKHMKVAKGMKVNLFADEKMFPGLLVNPVQMAWDTRGRLWVACWNSYPRWRPKDQMQDKLLIFEDTDGDGKADKCTVFLDHLNCPTGFEFYNGGVFVAQAPALWFAKDTNGDDKADQITRVLEGFDSADTHHTCNSFTFDPGGALYWQEGTFMHSQIETLDGPIRASNGAVWRFEPRTFRFDAYTSYGFANPHGHVFDYWGTDIIIDGTGAQPYYGPTFTGKMYFPDKHKGAPQVYRQRTRPCPGAEILSSKHFPDEMQGNLLVANVIAPTVGILNYRLTEKGAGLTGKETQVLVEIDPKDDRNFRPSDIEIGPDGAIYFTDWQNAIIGHMQHHIRDPNRDHEHGRIYRVTYEGRPLEKPAQIAGQSVEKLLDLLKETGNRTRYRAKIELSAHDPKEVIAAVEKWLAALDKNDKDYEHNRTEVLWMYQWNNVVNEPLLRQVLKSPDHHARAAATRVLCYWRDRIPGALDLVKVMAVDDHPRVRLEAVRAASFFTDPRAQEVALESLNKPQDEYLKYALDETMRTLEKHAK
jgi:glucose/arabinose dehydrogenase